MRSKRFIILVTTCLLTFSANSTFSNAAGKPSGTPGNGGGKSVNNNSSGATSSKNNGNSSNSNKPADAGKGKSAAQAKSESVEDSISAEDLECGTTQTVKSSSPSQGSGKSKSAAKKPAGVGKTTTIVAEDCSLYIVAFSPGFSDSARATAIGATKSKVLREFTNVFKGALISGPASKISALANNPNVKYLEADGKVTKDATQNLPTWGLDRIDQRTLPLSGTFNYGENTASAVNVYVVDTGINTSHTEFTGRLLPGYSAITGGIEDCNGHGTHVAANIAGSTFGVAKSANIIPVRVLDCSGSGTYSTVISGLDWIAANAPAGSRAVVNLSLGGPASSTLDAAVKNLISKGHVVVVAAGNSNTDACSASPARVVEAITVGATTQNDSRANFSNYGTCLDVFAPGTAITSAWTGSPTATNNISGTSMSAPHVAGIVARFIYSNPSLSPSQIASSLKSGATSGVISSAGTGSLNLLAYLDFIFDGSLTSEPVEVPRTVAPGNSGESSKKPSTKPGKSK
jgi:subtilisin family serine protease